jgi:diguanylate cyclase (GGDEF)-like protein/PAS domain S-box-containing protein
MVRQKTVIADSVVLVGLFLVGLYVNLEFDVIRNPDRAHERTIGLDEALLLGIVMTIGLLVFSVRRYIEAKRTAEAQSLKTTLLEAETETTIDGILAVDEADNIVLVNKQFGRAFGIPSDLLSLKDDVLLRAYVRDSMADPEAFLQRVKELNGNRTEKSRDELRLKNGTVFDRYSAPLVDAEGRYRGRIWYFRDITDRKTAAARIEFLAHHDALTGLPHRIFLHDRLENALEVARENNEKLALLFLDLDHFKVINDTFGHSFGDLVLKEVAKRLKESVQECDTVARTGGEEFVILVGNVKDDDRATMAAQQIMQAMSTSFDIQGQSVRVGCSLGVSMYPEHGTDGDTLIKNADAAMYAAKENGRGHIRFFTEMMNTQAIERFAMERDLRRALDREEFFLVYQPQVEIESREIIGFEALIRWQHPELGLVPPDKFIPIAEGNGLIVPIGEWVLRTACAQARKWHDSGLLPTTMAVNVSTTQFRQENFRTLVGSVLQDTGLPAKYLELELTESLLLSDADEMLAALQDLKDMGLQLSIDDFGTGYSSLSYLKQFPVGKLKIDRSFVRDIAVDSDDAAITTAIISMAHSLNLNVIAEGVETEAQMRFLRELGCHEIQGYLFSKPVSSDQAALMLQCQQSNRCHSSNQSQTPCSIPSGHCWIAQSGTPHSEASSIVRLIGHHRESVAEHRAFTPADRKVARRWT